MVCITYTMFNLGWIARKASPNRIQPGKKKFRLDFFQPTPNPTQTDAYLAHQVQKSGRPPIGFKLTQTIHTSCVGWKKFLRRRYRLSFFINTHKGLRLGCRSSRLRGPSNPCQWFQTSIMNPHPSLSLKTPTRRQSMQ